MTSVAVRRFLSTRFRSLWNIRDNIRVFGLVPSVVVAGRTFQQIAHLTSPFPAGKIALVTFTINPDLAKIWHFFAAGSVGTECDIYCVDSSGALLPGDVEGARVIHFWNIEHGAKMDFFSTLLSYDCIWFCDDDVMFRDRNGLAWAMSELQADYTWAASLLPRSQKVKVDGFEQRAMGSYCFMFKRSIYLKEAFSFRVKETHDPNINWGMGYFDTCDYAHYQSLGRGYRVALLEDALGSPSSPLLAFMGTSILYLKMHRKINSAEKLREDLELVPDNWRRISGILGSAFCLCKVYELYKLLFDSKPKWTPPISEADIMNIADSQVDARAKDRALSYFERYQVVFDQLASIAGETTSQPNRCD